MSSNALSNGHQTLPPTSDRKPESAESSKATVKKKTSSRKSYRHTTAVHTTVAASVLSKEAPPASYRGFMNLAMLILAASNVRLIIENYLKYGFLMSRPGTFVPPSDYILFSITFIALPFNLFFAYLIEKMAVKPFLAELKRVKAQDQQPTLTPKILSVNRRAGILHIINITITILYPTLIDLRLNQVSSQDKNLESPYTVAYPNNITFGDILYFWFAPTLCYQPSYPRASQKFRLGFFLKRVGEILIACTMMYFLIEQYANPTLKNSVRAMDELALVNIVERLLKLSTTSLLIWLLMFYAFFHSYMNVLSEVLEFGDRTFYLDWWNSGSLETYWRLWNRPVYHWFKRHVYLPLVGQGVPPMVATLTVFTISAALHELMVGVPTHAIMGYAFGGMMAQIPLITLSKPLEKWRGKGSTLGNVLFWVSFCLVGQPACVLLYYYQWVITHRVEPA
ncbi:9507_t:CDS:2 [Paraglomus occultum]|uniref:O-acyltransferase n=1 Tax=Paraglomus occultum TaxID=144539 RepID=A0A9N9CD45_9GLOM|nr:9507_t:CDS:2 [Paraglomus occultum]